MKVLITLGTGMMQTCNIVSRYYSLKHFSPSSFATVERYISRYIVPSHFPFALWPAGTLLEGQIGFPKKMAGDWRSFPGLSQAHLSPPLSAQRTL